jgi:2-polyprenyl-6-methoxyphenol hydroxylase-like FAD-dependent oxidoreductase
MEATNRTAVVIGAGIGGLATARALVRQDIDVRAFERRPSLDEAQFGTGLTLWSNAVKALRRLGLGDEIENAGPHMERFDQRSWKGAKLSSWPIGELSRGFGAPTVNVTRERLHRMLSEALEPGVVTYGTTCSGFVQDDAGVTASFENREDAGGDVLVGADGINSTVRATMFGSEPPRYAGYTAWRGLVPFEHEGTPPQVFQQIWGPGSRFAFYHVDGERLYWIAVANAPKREQEAPAGVKGDLLERFRGWMEPVEAIIAATDEAAIQRMDIEDRDPVEHWGQGRVTLLGDAIHAMTFNVGQGACQAIEDAVVLADALAQDGDPVAALRAYEEQRKKRTAGMMKLARRIGRMAQWENPLAIRLRDQIWKQFLGRVGVKGQARHMRHEV